MKRSMTALALVLTGSQALADKPAVLDGYADIAQAT